MPINIQMFLFCLLWISIVQKSPTVLTFKKREDIENIIKLYKDNDDFRKKIDETINSATSFNSLLGVIREKKEELLGYNQEMNQEA